MGGRACLHCLHRCNENFNLLLSAPGHCQSSAQIRRLFRSSAERLLGLLFHITDATVQAHIILLESETARPLYQSISHRELSICSYCYLHCHRLHSCDITYLPCLEPEHESTNQNRGGWNSWNGCSVSGSSSTPTIFHVNTHQCKHRYYCPNSVPQEFHQH